MRVCNGCKKIAVCKVVIQKPGKKGENEKENVACNIFDVFL